MKICNTIQNSGTVMHFLVQNLKIKNGEQLKHRNIMNEILFCGFTVKIIETNTLLIGRGRRGVVDPMDLNADTHKFRI